MVIKWYTGDMPTEKPRINLTLFDIEKAKLEKLSEIWGISQSRVVGRLLREYKLDELDDNDTRKKYYEDYLKRKKPDRT
jgi:hypothetical protein